MALANRQLEGKPTHSSTTQKYKTKLVCWAISWIALDCFLMFFRLVLILKRNWPIVTFFRGKEEGDNYLDAAKRSKGGDFADGAVDERVGMFKFSVVLLLLIPVAFSTTLPKLPVDLTVSLCCCCDGLNLHEGDTMIQWCTMQNYITSIIHNGDHAKLI